MARIHCVYRRGRYQVSIRGPLSVGDLARLERACGPALVHERVPLDIRLTGLTTMDEASRRFLGRLATRGASISES